MSDSVSLQGITDFAEDLALEAGELIRRERDNNTLRTDYKQQTELVTHADIMADEFITDAIRKRFPTTASCQKKPCLTSARLRIWTHLCGSSTPSMAR